MCERAECDIVLLDVMMPDMDGFEVCRKLKSNPITHHIPVVMVTALDQPSDRVRGLEAGADDFLTKPVSDVALISRVRSLARLKMVTDELRLRALTTKEIGIESPEREAVAETGRNGRILIVDDRKSSYERIVATLSAEHTVDVESNPSEALFHAAEGNYDLLIVSLGLKDFDGLRLCSQVRSLERTRNVPILAVAEPDNNTKLVRGLEIGVNDYLLRPVDKNEMLARVRTQIKKKRYTERLRDNVQMSIEMAITDALTGLFNRRSMETHLSALVEQAASRGKPIAVLVLDIDFFKSINDGHGHDAPAFELSDEEKSETLEKLGGPIYLVGKITKFILLRTDELLAHASGVTYQHKQITIEHVLPQTPKSDSVWVQDFSDDQREHWTHRLGNLVLLNKAKNSAANNYDFHYKKSTYFSTGHGVNNFAVTSQVIQQPVWTPAVVEERHKTLVALLAQEWALA